MGWGWRAWAHGGGGGLGTLLLLRAARAHAAPRRVCCSPSCVNGAPPPPLLPALQCTGSRFEHRVCEFYNLVLYRDQLHYISQDGEGRNLGGRLGSRWRV